MAQIPATVFIDGVKADVRWFNSIQEMTVEQDWGRPTEARILFPIVTDVNGVWMDMAGRSQVPSGTRLRVEVSADGKTMVPLLDGEVVQVESRKSSEPGESLAVLVVRDDSEVLDRDGGLWIFEDETPENIVRTLLAEKRELFPEVVLESADEFRTAGKQAFVHRGSLWEGLCKIAKLYGAEIFVRPGSEKSTSRAFFVKVPQTQSRKKDLWINGPVRNLDEVEILDNFYRSPKVQAYDLELESKQIGQYLARSDSSAHLQLARVGPGAIGSQIYAIAEMEREKRGVLLRGKIRMGAYDDILDVFSWVRVGGTGERFTGDYLISKVLHRFLGGVWEQEIGLLGTANKVVESGRSPVGRIF